MRACNSKRVGEKERQRRSLQVRAEKSYCVCLRSFAREPLTKRRHKNEKGLFAPAKPEKHVHKTETHYPHFTMPPIHPPQHVRNTQPAPARHPPHTARIPSRFDSAQMNARCAHVAHRDAPLLPLLLLLARSSLAKCTEKNAICYACVRVLVCNMSAIIHGANEFRVFAFATLFCYCRRCRMATSANICARYRQSECPNHFTHTLDAA